MNTSSNQFGLIVAYLLPGFVALAGIAPFAPVVMVWLHPLSQAEASVGPPIYALLAATTIGMIINCFRWLLIDHIHQWTGVRPPVWDDGRLEERLAAFNYLVENHYRYYQFVANTLVALVWAYSINRSLQTSSLLGVGTDLGVLILCAVLFAGSRDALSKYYTRTGRLVGQVAEKGPMLNVMHNGNDHGVKDAASTESRPQTKPQSKPQPSPMPKEDKNRARRSVK